MLFDKIWNITTFSGGTQGPIEKDRSVSLGSVHAYFLDGEAGLTIRKGLGPSIDVEKSATKEWGRKS